MTLRRACVAIGAAILGLAGCGSEPTGQPTGAATTTNTGGDAGTQAPGECAVACPELVWSRTFARGDSGLSLVPIAVDAAGNSVLAVHGVSGDELGVAPGWETSLVTQTLVKLSPEGELLWARPLAVDGYVAVAMTIAANASGDFVVAGVAYGGIDFGGGLLPTPGSEFMSPSGNPLPGYEGLGFAAFAARFDASGDHVWSRAFGDPSDTTSVEEGWLVPSARTASIDDAGRVLLTGWMRGTIDFGGGPLVAAPGNLATFAVELDEAGQHVWSTSFAGGPPSDPWPEISGGSDPVTGDAVISASFEGSLDLGGETLTSAPGGSLLLARVDPGGAAQWTRVLELPAGDVTVGPAGSALLQGRATGLDVDLGAGLLPAADGESFLGAFSPSGELLWSRRLAVPWGAFLLDAAGRVGFAGGIEEPVTLEGVPLGSPGANQWILGGLDATGALTFARAVIAESDTSRVSSLALKPTRELVLSGHFGATLDLGGAAPLQSQLGDDAFVAVLAPP